MNSFLRSTYFKTGLDIVTFILLFLAVFPFFCKDRLKAEFEKALRNQVLSELRLEGVDLSFFGLFPSLTLTLDQLDLGRSAPFTRGTLLYANELAFGVGLPSLFSDQVKAADFDIQRDYQELAIFRKMESCAEFAAERKAGLDYALSGKLDI